jgi:NAD+ synthetase
VKILVAQINSTVGDFRSNAAKISGILRDAPDDCDLIIFPECALCGYPPQDLLDYPQFAVDAERAAAELAAAHPQRFFVFGSIESRKGVGRPLANVAHIAAGGKIVKTYSKRLLPTYDVFDEDRFFEPGRKAEFFECAGKKIAITICEDIWASGPSWIHNRYAQNPLLDIEGVDLVINISASPFEVKKVSAKEQMLSQVAKNHRVQVLYVNAVGANDSLIFDGRSYLISPSGQVQWQGAAFDEDIHLIDTTESSLTLEANPHQPWADLHSALVLGIRDYCRKMKFKEVIVGLSGGIDSSVVACLAADALGPEKVVGVLMPSRFTAAQSNKDALDLARVLQNPIHLIPIETMQQAADLSLSKAFEGTESGIAEENIQSRIRGLLLMALSNKFHPLVLTTGNKSELAVGYCTLYGDMNGGLAPLADLYKTEVYELGRYLNRLWSRIPESCFTKAPSAELRPGQRDQDSLPEYEVLDRILFSVIEEFKSREDLIKEGCDAQIVDHVLQLLSRSEFKRYQMPLGLKVSSKAFGFGRRMPLVQRWWNR